jgi:transposase InsO family protein
VGVRLRKHVDKRFQLARVVDRAQHACELSKRLGLRHIRTKPYTPKTNGKVERFIQTSLREWAYARAYENSRQRKEQLPTGRSAARESFPVPGREQTCSE